MSLLTTLKTTLSSALQPVVAGYVYDMKYGRARVKRKGGLGFLPRILRRSTMEEEFLTALDLEGRTVYDIGGFIGLLTVVFAKAVGPTGRVVVFEPNEGNCLRIQEHIALNQVHNVKLLRLGIADTRRDNQLLVVRRSESGTGSMDESIQSQIIAEGHFRELRVNVDTLDDAIVAHDLPKPDLIKIDIEGMEYAAMLGMSKTLESYSPQLYVEIHGADESSKRDNIRRIVERLQAWGYSIWHVETRQDITMSNSATAEGGHIFCRRL
jgi:FkbM family methyltransferase